VNKSSAGDILKRKLRDAGFLRSSYYLLIELRRTLSDNASRDRRLVDLSYEHPDPWGDSTEVGREYLTRASKMLEAVAGGAMFRDAFDIGCAEGAFAELIAPHCGSILGGDLSPDAISRAKNRTTWPASVRFATWDLRNDPMPGPFDLIVVSGVLEYIHNPLKMRELRAKLVAGLIPGGYLQIGTTRANPVVEKSWFGRWLKRGKWINGFFAEHPSLKVVSTHTAPTYELTLFRKAAEDRERPFLWNALRRIAFLRSAVYLAIELLRSLREPGTTSKNYVDSEFKDGPDPFHYETSATNHARFLRQRSMLDSARKGLEFQNALEIGCAEGHFTEILSELSRSLLVLELSPTALARARTRRAWGAGVSFREWDLKNDAIPGKYELIVVTGVLEYFQRRSTFRKIRSSLVSALEPGGYLLLESAVSQNPNVANAWWSKYLIRGKWINDYFARHKELELIENAVLDIFVITLLRKRRPDATGIVGS